MPSWSLMSQYHSFSAFRTNDTSVLTYAYVLAKQVISKFRSGTTSILSFLSRPCGCGSHLHLPSPNPTMFLTPLSLLHFPMPCPSPHTIPTTSPLILCFPHSRVLMTPTMFLLGFLMTEIPASLSHESLIFTRPSNTPIARPPQSSHVNNLDKKLPPNRLSMQSTNPSVVNVRKLN